MRTEFPRLSGKEFLILELLEDRGEMFGLAMVDASNGELKKGTVYVTLQRMAEKGLIDSREEARPEGENGTARRIYQPTGLGKRLLKSQKMALTFLNLGWEN